MPSFLMEFSNECASLSTPTDSEGGDREASDRNDERRDNSTKHKSFFKPGVTSEEEGQFMAFLR